MPPINGTSNGSLVQNAQTGSRPLAPIPASTEQLLKQSAQIDSLASEDFTDGCLPDAELVADLLLRPSGRVEIPDYGRGRWLKFAMWVIVRYWSITTLGVHVKVVLRSRTKKQVAEPGQQDARNLVGSRIVVSHASAVVTSVANHTAVRDWYTAGQLPCNSVDCTRIVTLCAWQASGCAHRTVPVFHKMSRPLPATSPLRMCRRHWSGVVNLFPQPFGNRTTVGSTPAPVIAELRFKFNLCAAAGARYHKVARLREHRGTSFRGVAPQAVPAVLGLSLPSYIVLDGAG